MEPLRVITGRAYPWGASNVDTDIIIPAVYMKTIGRKGLGRGAFQAVRANADNIFDDPRYAGASILIAGDNFGCGSSREHAVWALLDLGVRVIIAPSFSDIFAGNAVRNGILPVALARRDVDQLLIAAEQGELTVNLESCKITTTAGAMFEFQCDTFRRECLLGGLDEIDLTIKQSAAISGFEKLHWAGQPWLCGLGEQSQDAVLAEEN